MRLLLAAIECPKGDLDANVTEHLRVLTVAENLDCDVAVFPEMSLTGSVDPASHPERLIDIDHPAVASVAAATTRVAAVFGAAERSGPSIAQVVSAGGRIVGVQRKRHLGDGEEAFAAADGDVVFDLAGRPTAIAICAEAGIDRPFTQPAEIVLFCAAPGLYGRRTDEASWRAGWDWWRQCSLGDATRHARAHGLWIALTTQAGSTEDEDFPGLAALVSPDGHVVAQLGDWRPGLLVVNVP